MTFYLTMLLYVSACSFLAGMGWRIFKWLRTPVPLKIVLTPAPKTKLGVSRRLAGEIFGFRSLFQADRVLWTQAWLFHVSLLLLLVGHIGGLVVPEFARGLLGMDLVQFHRFAQITGGAAGLLAIFSLLSLLIRRQVVERLRWISTLGDYFALLLLLLIIATGNQMRAGEHFDLTAARQFVAGCLTFHPLAVKSGLLFAIHVCLVCALLIYIPFSKLVHLGGATLFSPTLNQLNNPREHRHIHESATT